MSSFIESIDRSLVYDVASGYNSGYSMVTNFSKNRVYQGTGTYLSMIWSGFKTAYKTTALRPDLGNRAYIGFAAWAFIYSVSVPSPEEGTIAGTKVYRPNVLVRMSPKIILITRIALTYIEYATKPRKAIIASATFVVYALDLPRRIQSFAAKYLGDDEAAFIGAINISVPIAAKVTLIVLGDPFTKVTSSVELAFQVCGLFYRT